MSAETIAASGEKLSAALQYVQRGWAVVALHDVTGGGCSCQAGAACDSAGKHPVAGGWQAAPLTTRGAVEEAWRRNPHANVGIATGAPSGVWVLDVDRIDSLDRLEAEHGTLPPTYQVRTGSGGLHLYFAVPDGVDITNSRGRLKEYPGLDVRGTGGQVVAPPSVSGKGSYEVTEDWPPAQAPGWLIDMIRPAGRKPAQTPLERPVGGNARLELNRNLASARRVPEGKRNDTISAIWWNTHKFAVAGGIDPDEIDALFREVCEAHGGIDDTEIRKLQGSARKGLDEPTDVPPPWGEGGYLIPFADAPVDARHAARIDWRTFFGRERKGDDWLIEPFLARGRGHAIFAPAKGGKSLLIASVLVPAALGRPTLRRPAGEPLRVLYLDYEMVEDDVEQRLVDMGVGFEDVDALEALAYHLLPSIAPLDTPEGGATVLALATEHRADVVVIDTMARAVQGGENESDTYRDYYRCTGQRLKAEGIATIRADHAGKDLEKGQRGSSSKNDDVDLVWRLTPRDGGRYTLTATHKRMGWVPGTVDLELKDDPLRFELAAETWPAGTAAAAAVLDRLGVPAGAGRDKARAAMKQAGESVGTEVLAAALRYRKARAAGRLSFDPECGTGSLSTDSPDRADRSTDRSPGGDVDRSADRPPRPPSDLPGQVGGQVWTGSPSLSGQVPPSIGGTVHGHPTTVGVDGETSAPEMGACNVCGRPAANVLPGGRHGHQACQRVAS